MADPSTYDWITLSVSVGAAGLAGASLAVSIVTFRRSGPVLTIDEPFVSAILRDDCQGYFWRIHVTLRNQGRLPLHVENYRLHVEFGDTHTIYISTELRDLLSRAGLRSLWVPRPAPVFPHEIGAGVSLDFHIPLLANEEIDGPEFDQAPPGSSCWIEVPTGTGAVVKSPRAELKPFQGWRERADRLAHEQRVLLSEWAKHPDENS